MQHNKCLGLLFILLTMISVFAFPRTMKGMEKKTIKPDIKGVTWEESEVIAKKAIHLFTEKYMRSPDSIVMWRIALVRSLGPDRNDCYFFLVETRFEGSDTPSYGKAFVDSLLGETIPYDVVQNPIHPIGRDAIENSVFGEQWVLNAFAKGRGGKAKPMFWSLVRATPNTSGHYEYVGPEGEPKKNMLWEFNVTSALPVWLVTDDENADFLVFSNGQIKRIYDLDPKVKAHIWHRTMSQNSTGRR